MRHGFLLIDKPEGPTSHDIVGQVRRALPEKKVGHLGTLDPAASGLLVLAVGAKALKVVELYNDMTKQYEAAITFGAVSATYDREGPIEELQRKPGVVDPTDSDIQEAIRNKFIGKVQQVPPAASAVHIDGKRAYQKMRQGEVVDMPSRMVEIEVCRLLQYTYPELTLQVTCGSGTYIRSLAHDLGATLRVGAYLSALRRTKVGDWSVDNAVTPDQVKWTDVIPLKEVLKDRTALEITEQQLTDISHGKITPGTCEPNTIAWCNGLPVAVLEMKDSGVKARKVF